MVYYFIKNVQGDIIGILNSNYELIVKYEYDSFGNILSIRDQNDQIIIAETNIGIINPFRYRGYYYDKETKLYYLNARYYNPKWGRFLNADEIIKINNNFLPKNLFLYMNNNYINSKDYKGTDSLNEASDILKKINKLLGAFGALGAAKAEAASIASAYAPYVLLTFGIIWATMTIADALSSAKSKKLLCEKPKTVYKRAYVSEKTNNLITCKDELTYNAAIHENSIGDKNSFRKKLN